MEGRRWPHLADAGDIQRWAEYSVNVRHEFPRVVRTLIRQTNDQVIRLDMRAGKGTDVRGYDGIVEAGKATPFVPAGLSVWELGTGADTRRKASDDYRDRTENSLGVDKSTTTFVFATPREWPDKQAWADEKRAEGIWADVRAFDVSDVEMALEAAPAAHVALSETLDRPAIGVWTIDDWWQRFSAITRPELSPELVLAGRADEAAELLRLIQEERRVTTISAPSTDDVLAFVAGTLLTSPEAERSDLLARTLIVQDAISLRMLEGSSSLLILLPFEEELRRAAELVRSHQVIFLASDNTPSDIELPPVDRDVFASVLEGVGVDEKSARRLAAAAYRSIRAFQREPATGGALPREWSSALQSKASRRAWLAGSWNERRSGDLEVMAALFGTPYEDAREELAPLATGEDPLFTVVGSTWALVSAEDAWPFGSRVINDFDLPVLETAVQTVLGAIDPALELPAEQRWTANLYGKIRIHSSDLRGGLATTLALCGALGEKTQLGSVGALSTWAANVIHRLLERANDDASGQLWASLADVLPLLAEAVPDVFLSAVETGVRGDEPLLRLMFADRESVDGLSVSSPHTGLLWALETVAWSETHAARAARVLARLTEIDPGGRLGNRPANSLTSMFRSWLPQTSLSMERRLGVLDGLQRDHEGVAWSLMLQLLPEPHAVGHYSHSPRFRAWKPATEGVTPKEFWDFSSSVAERVLDMADRKPARWTELVKRFADLPPTNREDAFQRLTAQSAVGAEDDAQRQHLWEVIDEMVRQHRAFSDADWALPPAEVDRLAEVAHSMKPSDPVEANRWLFDDHLPELRKELGTVEDRMSEVDAARVTAVGEIFDVDGLDGVLRLAVSVKFPGFVGVAVASRGVEELDERLLVLLDADDGHLARLADGYSFERAKSGGWTWISDGLQMLTGRPAAQARLLLQTRDLSQAWRAAAELGSEVEDAYWREFSIMGRGQDFGLVNEALEALLKHGRVVDAIDMMAMYSRPEGSSVRPELMLEALERLLEAPPEPDEFQRLSSYELELLLTRLRASSTVDEDRLASLEWRLLPARGFQARSPILERRLARDPEFFVEILSLLYRRKNGGNNQESAPEHVARNAFHLLQEWKIVPGSTEQMGEVDEQQLLAWLTTARELLKTADRHEVGDIHIGHVFAHARGDEDGTWPTRPVRDAIERSASAEIEDGFRSQIYNNRGVTSRNPMDGGGQERGLASRYRDLAAPIQDEWPRTAAVLLSLAEGYEAEARRHDEYAERLRQGLDE